MIASPSNRFAKPSGHRSLAKFGNTSRTSRANPRERQKEPIISNDFHYACKLDELQAGKPKSVEILDRYVVLVRYDAQVYCIEDLCTHDGGTLGDGELDGYCLVCPRHGAKFDVRNGHVVCMPATENTPSHEVRIDGDQVLVRLSD